MVVGLGKLMVRFVCYIIAGMRTECMRYWMFYAKQCDSNDRNICPMVMEAEPLYLS